MKEEDFFRQTLHDPVDRQQKIEELLYQCKVTKVLVIGFIVVLGGFAAYRIISEGRWRFDFGGGWLSVLLTTLLYSSCRTRLAALRSMEAKEPEPAPSAPERLAN